MKKKKLSLLLCAAAVGLSISACNSAATAQAETSTGIAAESVPETKDYSNQTVTGRVKSLDGTSLTIEIGRGGQGGGMGGPEGQRPQGTPPETKEGETLPEPPTDANGETLAAPPEKPSGESGSNGTRETPPEKPSGESESDGTRETPPEKPTDANGETLAAPPERPSGESGTGDGKEHGNPPQGETVVFSIDGASIVKESDGNAKETTAAASTELTEGTMVTLEVGDNLTVKTIRIRQMQEPPKDAPQSAEASQTKAAS